MEMTLDQLITPPKKGSVSFIALTSKNHECSYCEVLTLAEFTLRFREGLAYEYQTVARVCALHKEIIKVSREAMKNVVLRKRSTNKSLSFNPYSPLSAVSTGRRVNPRGYSDYSNR
jgi:hypothetical protein